MKIKDKCLFIAQELENKAVNIDKAQDSNISFFEALKAKQKQNKHNMNAYEIAEKIAKGEFVSMEELKYLKENAPELYAKALMIYQENIRRRMNNKEGKQEEDMMFLLDDENNNKCVIDTMDKNNYGICSKVEAHNSSLSMGQDESMESIIQQAL